jgi:hypothetical protein
LDASAGMFSTLQLIKDSIDQSTQHTHLEGSAATATLTVHLFLV